MVRADAALAITTKLIDFTYYEVRGLSTNVPSLQRGFETNPLMHVRAN